MIIEITLFGNSIIIYFLVLIVGILVNKKFFNKNIYSPIYFYTNLIFKNEELIFIHSYSVEKNKYKHYMQELTKKEFKKLKKLNDSVTNLDNIFW